MFPLSLVDVFIRGGGANAIVAQQVAPCPMVLGMDSSGKLRSMRGGTWGSLSEKTLRADLSADSACYPESGPRPISSVEVRLLSHVPRARQQWLFDLLTSYGWTEERISVRTVKEFEER
ncbi:MAG: hypothetical protein HOQ35_19460 [Acidobacteriaceae bacterium]|nr:hypothetical protein [Acidobacteriaceae bacterium]